MIKTEYLHDMQQYRKQYLKLIKTAFLCLPYHATENNIRGYFTNNFHLALH